MVKGISRQVIVVHAPETKLFEQAIFILKEDAATGVTDEQLLKEATQAVRSGQGIPKRRRLYRYGAFWAAGGASIVGIIWIITSFL